MNVLTVELFSNQPEIDFALYNVIQIYFYFFVTVFNRVKITNEKSYENTICYFFISEKCRKNKNFENFKFTIHTEKKMIFGLLGLGQVAFAQNCPWVFVKKKLCWHVDGRFLSPNMSPTFISSSIFVIKIIWHGQMDIIKITEIHFDNKNHYHCLESSEACLISDKYLE